MNFRVVLVVVTLLAGCTGNAGHLKDGDEAEVLAKESQPDTNGRGEEELPEDSIEVLTQDATRSMFLDECQQGMVTGHAPSYGFPFPAALGWERTGDEIPQSQAYLRVVRCESASVFGLETLEDVSFGWFSSDNVTHNETLDGIGYNELQASTALFCSRTLCEHLEVAGYETTDADIRLHPAKHSIVVELAGGRLVVDLEEVLVEPANSTLPWRFLVVPTDASHLWFSANQESVNDNIALAGFWSSEGQTPMGDWLSKQPSGTFVEGRLMPGGSLEVNING